jgi:hypothetical protein
MAQRILCTIGLMSAILLMIANPALAAATRSDLLAADSGQRRWTDDQLVASYRDLASGSGLEGAVRSPALPKDPPRPGFLDALAWYAAGTPDRPGVLTLKTLDELLASNVQSYLGFLKAKVERVEDNDYPRTRTWKVIQKLTLLREEMSQPQRKGRYSFTSSPKASADPSADTWDRKHTLRSYKDFGEKVCRASYTRPILVKFGSTNCTQCMLFEIMGSVKSFAENPEHKGTVDVYKVWWGYRPDAGFAGRIRNPNLLNGLVKAEEVPSSPYFVIYRNGRRYPCGDAFPDDRGHDDRLDACMHQDFGEAPESTTCASLDLSNGPRAGQ